MEGLGKRESNKTFLGVFDGNFELRYKTAQPGCKTRVNKNGKTIFFEDFASVEGTLCGLSMKESEIIPGQKMMFYIIALRNKSGHVIQFDLQESSSSTFSLLGKIARIDPALPIKINVWADVKNEKKTTNWALYQNNASVKSLWTKENPNGCPDLKKVNFRGKDQWDDVERNEYVREFLATNIVAKIQAPVSLEHNTEGPDGPQDDTDETQGSEAPDWLKKDEAPPITAADEKPHKANPAPATPAKGFYNPPPPAQGAEGVAPKPAGKPNPLTGKK